MILPAPILARAQACEVRLSELTTLRVGGPAQLLTVDRAEDLPELLQEPYRILGKGANLLVGSRGVAENLLRFGPGMAQLQIDGRRVRVGAAYDLGKLVAACCRQGLAGLEGLAGVPATVGGACWMNAGTATCWLLDRVARLQVLISSETAPRWLSRAMLPAVYRSCGLPPGSIVLAAELQLSDGEPAELKQRAAELKRRKAATQPLTERSAGCIFKNPSTEQAAGRLLDELGLKGERVGAAVVSQQHANFIINEGTATADEVCRLILRLRRRVWRERGIVLDCEVQTWNCPPELQAHPEELSDD